MTATSISHLHQQEYVSKVLINSIIWQYQIKLINSVLGSRRSTTMLTEKKSDRPG